MTNNNVPDTLDFGAFMAGYLDKQNRDKIHTMIPGEIISYNRVKRTCVVQPSVKRNAPEGIVSYTPLADVKVQFPHGGGYGISFDLVKGDTGGIFFSEASLAEWIVEGGLVTPKSKRHHHIADAIFVPGVIPDKTLPSYTHSGDGISIHNSTGSKKIVLNSGGVDVDGDLSVKGDITATGDIVAGTTSLKTHTHLVTTAVTNATPATPGPVTGAGNTAVPS